jgi:putative addiction module component (TIGR02574 family)
MIAEKIAGIEKLSASEKMLLVSELWNELAAHPGEVPVQQKIIDELDRRIAEYERNPRAVTAWEDVSCPASWI